MASTGGKVTAKHRFPKDKVEEVKEAFDKWNLNDDKVLDHSEMVEALKAFGSFDERTLEDILKEVDENKDGVIDFTEFLNALWKLQSSGDKSAFGSLVKKQLDLIAKETASGGLHTYAADEVSAFANHLNYVLGDDPDLDYLMPIDPDTEDLFYKVKDGVLLAKFINVIEENTIDWRAVNFKKGGGLSVFKIIENQSLNIASAKSLGLRITNVSPEELRDAEKNQTLLLGFMWQAVKMQLLGSVNLKAHPELVRLLQDGETMADLLSLPPEEILKRWVNYHMAKQDFPRRIKNFGGDIKDAEVYTVLLKSIAPDKCDLSGLEMPVDKRAEKVLDGAEKVGASVFIKPGDILSGNDKLNLAFVAQLFNACPGLEEITEDEEKELAGLMDDDEGDSREERAFRMWINTLDRTGELYINNLFEDCKDGLALLKVIDLIEPGTVDWSKVEKKPNNRFKKLANANYAVVLCKALKLSVVGIGGSDVVDGNKKLLLAITWQLMRYHMLKFLSELSRGGKKITDKDVLDWANETVSSSGKSTSITSFGDKALQSGVFFCNLVGAVNSDIMDWELVTPGATDEQKLLNARYAITIGRKMGAIMFLLPEDIVEARPKMCLTFAAAIMARALKM
jgi:plastin-1